MTEQEADREDERRATRIGRLDGPGGDTTRFESGWMEGSAQGHEDEREAGGFRSREGRRGGRGVARHQRPLLSPSPSHSPCVPHTAASPPDRMRSPPGSTHSHRARAGSLHSCSFTLSSFPLPHSLPASRAAACTPRIHYSNSCWSASPVCKGSLQGYVDRADWIFTLSQTDLRFREVSFGDDAMLIAMILRGVQCNNTIPAECSFSWKSC